MWRTLLLCLVTISASAQANTTRVEFGPELTQVYFPVNPVGSVQYQPGFGAFGSLRLYKTVSVDSSFSITPTVPITGTSDVGGRLTQAFLGVRAGLSKGRIDVDAKVRPGLASFGSVILRITPPPNLQFFVGRLTGVQSRDAGQTNKNSNWEGEPKTDSTRFCSPLKPRKT